MSVDISLRTTVDVEGHQGYSFLFTILYGFAVGYSYTNSFSKTAQGFYIVGLVTMCICLFTGYQLVFWKEAIIVRWKHQNDGRVHPRSNRYSTQKLDLQ